MNRTEHQIYPVQLKVESKSNQSSAPKTQRRQFFAQKIGVNAGSTAISGIFVLRRKEIDPKTCVAAIRKAVYEICRQSIQQQYPAPLFRR